jgi:hypothetical protein
MNPKVKMEADEKSPPQHLLRDFIKTLPGAELGPDDLREEAYFYKGRNFLYFHGPWHVDIRLSLSEQKEAIRSGRARRHPFAPQAGWVSSSLTSENIDIVKDFKKSLRPQR